MIKFIYIVAVAGFCALNGVAAVIPRHNKPAIQSAATTQPSLAQDLDELARMIPTKDIQRLTIRYLLNDAQFQTFVRIINSHDSYLTHMRFRSQPEVVSFVTWVRSQIMLSGVELESAESNESLRIINRTPFWSQNVFGWQGFVNEFHLLYPEESIHLQAQTKAARNGIFAEFVQRLNNLKAAYERVIVTPEAQRVISALEAAGIDTAGIDRFIRNQFGWQQASNSGAAAGAAAP